MNRRRIIWALATITATVLAGAPAIHAQGVVWKTTITGEQIGTQNSTTAYMPGMIAVTGMNADGDALIFRLDRQMIYFLKKRAKKFTAVSFADFEAGMKKMGVAVDAQMAEALKQLESLPADQRAMVEKQIGAFMPKKEEGAVNVEKGTESRTVAGYAATRYTATRNNQTFLTAWTSTGIPGWKGMKKEFEIYMQKMSGINQFSKGFTEAFQKMDGFPLEMTMAGFTSTVTAVEVKNTPAVAFVVPPDYTEDPNELFGGSGTQEHD